MSDKTECPFEVGQWVTDGVFCGLVRFSGIHGHYVDTFGHTFASVDWSRWAAFDPGVIGLKRQSMHCEDAYLWTVLVELSATKWAVWTYNDSLPDKPFGFFFFGVYFDVDDPNFDDSSEGNALAAARRSFDGRETRRLNLVEVREEVDRG